MRPAASLLLVLVSACSLESKDLVTQRAERRMSANALHNLGLLHLRGADWAECVRVYDQVLARKRMAASAINRGYCLEQLGRSAEARAAFEAAAEAPGVTDEERLIAAIGRFAVASTEDERAKAADQVAELNPDAAASLSGRAAWPVELRTAGELPAPHAAPTGIMGD